MDHLLTEASASVSRNLDELAPLEFVRLMNGEDARVIPAVASQAEAIARAIEVVAERLRGGGRLVYAGAGTSGRLGVLDAAECPPTFSSPPGQVVGVIAGGLEALTRAVEGAEDHPEFAERDLTQLGFSANDVLLGIATSGRTPYVLGALAFARRQQAFTIGLACNPDAELLAHADLAITPIVGPEVLTGSTRLKAGTATKLVLNTLTTGVMVRLGKVYGNLMVDLRATNEKLRQRTNRIVRQLTGLGRDEADALLERCGRELKTALAVQLGRVTPEEARARLAAADGRLRAALEGSGSRGPSAAEDRPAAPSHVPETGSLFLGIDGGGSNTIALLARVTVVAREWKLLGRGQAGPSNLQAAGVPAALAALDDAVSRAFADARIARCQVTAACLGLAGAGRTDDQAIVRQWAERVGLADTILVDSDTSLLLAAGTPENWGAALVAGTGSMALVRNRAGHTARAGGWGYLLGDEGSGYALAVEALRAITKAADRRGTATDLTPRFLEALRLKEPQEPIAAVYRGGLDRATLAALAPLVFEAAAAGDAVADAIVSRGAEALAAAVAAAAQQCNLHQAPLPLALAGGVLLSSEDYRGRVLRCLVSQGIRPDPVALVTEPAEGALRMAVAAVRS
jgi:N-acetylmuramic acid 6-phosphate etherase